MKVFLSAKLSDVGRMFFTAFMCASMILTFVVCTGREQKKKKLGKAVNVTATQTERLPTVVIDAGHGGADGGCEGYDGSCEKDYNLANAKKLRVFFDMAGFDTVMTRDTDDDTDGDGSVGISDLTLISIYLSGKGELTPVQSACADMNEDSTVDAFDMFYIDKAIYA